MFTNKSTASFKKIAESVKKKVTMRRREEIRKP